MRLPWALLLLLAAPVRAAEPDPWEWRPPTIGETVLQAVAVGLIAVDIAQSWDIQNHPELREGNGILGGHPSRPALAAYGIGMAAGLTILWYRLPPALRSLVPGVTIPLQMRVIVMNAELGLVIRF